MNRSKYLKIYSNMFVICEYKYLIEISMVFLAALIFE